MRLSPNHFAAVCAALSRVLCAGAVILCARAMPAAAEGASVVASAVRLDQGGAGARLSFLVSGPVEGVGFVMANPDRAIIDLPEIEFRIDAAKAAKPPLLRKRGAGKAPAPAATLVAGYRFGLFSPGKSRVVIDLGAPARIVKARTETVEGDQHQLIIDLAPTDRAAFLAASRQRPGGTQTIRQSSSPAKSSPPRPDVANLPLIVVDPGHGGLDTGAVAANGTQEKDVVFDFTRTLQGQLEASGRYRVIMTRASDVFVPLDERVKIARDAGAALFISIHADTIGDEPGVSGATVYTGAEKASDRQAARVAEAENRADAVAGHEAGEDDSGVNDILFDLTRRETRAFSHVFARALVGRLKDASRLNKNPHRSAGFRVLKAPDVPAVLLELGYLSNEKDLPNLVAPEWRKKVADSMVRAVDEFFRARDGKSPRAESDLELERGVDDRQTNVVVGAQQ